MHVCVLGLAKPYIHMYIPCIYGNSGREITTYTVIYGVHIRFWPTLVFMRGNGEEVWQVGVFLVAAVFWLTASRYRLTPFKGVTLLSSPHLSTALCQMIKIRHFPGMQDELHT